MKIALIIAVLGLIALFAFSYLLFWAIAKAFLTPLETLDKEYPF